MGKVRVQYKDKVYEYEQAYSKIKDMKRREAIKCVINDIIDGATRSIIISKLSKDLYGVGKKYKRLDAVDVVNQARGIIEVDFEDFVANARKQLWNSAMDLYTESKDVGDRATALKTLQWVAKLSGLDDVQNINMNLNGNVTVDFGLEDEN